MRGQVSIEFLIAAVFLLLVLGVVMFVFSEKTQAFIQDKDRGEARLLAKSVAFAVDEVYSAGDGASRTLLLQRRADMNVFIVGNEVGVAYTGGFVEFPLVTASASMDTVAVPATVTFTNQGGLVHAETQ